MQFEGAALPPDESFNPCVCWGVRVSHRACSAAIPKVRLPVGLHGLACNTCRCRGSKAAEAVSPACRDPCAWFCRVATPLSSMAAPDFPRSLQLLAPLLPALLLFFVLSEWVETQRQISVIFVSLTVVGFVLATTLLVVSWLSGTGDSDAWARAVPSPLLVVKNDITVVAVLAPLALAVVSSDHSDWSGSSSSASSCRS